MIFKEMRNAVIPIMAKIFNQSFNRELAQGILPKKKFIYYLQQDALYLVDFAKALALASQRLTCRNQAAQLMQFSLDTIKAEQDIHASYLKKYQLPCASPIERSAGCFVYTNYIMKMAKEASVEESVASLLPCFWVYREVSKNISKAKSPNNPYESWIELYTGAEYHASVEVVIGITNTLAARASAETQKKMISAFIQSTQLEWYFWESAYWQEALPLQENTVPVLLRRFA